MQRFAFPVLFVGFVAGTVAAADWPQWMGPNRNGEWVEDGVCDSFPQQGPKKIWSVPIRGGYSGPAVAAGRVFVMDFVPETELTDNNPNKRHDIRGTERVLSLDLTTGKQLWKHEYPCTYSLSFPCGPRCTPTVDGGRVFTVGAMGQLFCFDVKTGRVIWSKDFVKEYSAPLPMWGFCGHPLVHKNLLICLVGGSGSLAVAFDTATGKEVWKSLSAKDSGYCPPSLIRVGHAQQLVIRCPHAIHALKPLTGDKIWHVKLEPKYGMSINAPQQHKEFLFAGGVGGHAVMLKLADGSDEPPTEVWRGTKETGLYPSNATPLLSDGTMYGCDSMTGAFMAVELATGKRLWETQEPTTGKAEGLMHGTAFAVQNGERHFIFNETGHLILAKLTPEKYTEISRAKLLEPTGEAFGRKVVWSHPAFADKKIFVRNDREIAAFDLAK